MKYATSPDGTRIAYQQSGSGPALLLVHGTTADHSRWTPIVPQLEDAFAVYAMDRRGRGGSDDDPQYELMREAEDVAAVVDAIGDPVHVLGHSYGALCSLEAALLTENINRLILYEPPLSSGTPPYAPNVPERMAVLIDDGEQEAALELFMREVVGMPESQLAGYRQLPVWPTRIQLAHTIPRELTAVEQQYQFDPNKFAAMQRPTLLLLGGDSPAMFKEAIARIDAALANGRIITLPNQQHIAMDTAPDLFIAEVKRFLLE